MIALVLGGADCLWDDIRQFGSCGYVIVGRRDACEVAVSSASALIGSEAPTVIATNAAGVYYPGHVDHWVTLHPENWLGQPGGGPGWMEQRRQRGGNLDAVRWSERLLPPDVADLHGCQVDRTTIRWRGTSGLLAIKVACELGFERIVLCGVPMEDRGHFDEPAKGFAGATTFQTQWLEVVRLFYGQVRSMSGWTRRLHGAPTREWLMEGARV